MNLFHIIRRLAHPSLAHHLGIHSFLSVVRLFSGVIAWRKKTERCNGAVGAGERMGRRVEIEKEKIVVCPMSLSVSIFERCMRGDLLYSNARTLLKASKLRQNWFNPHSFSQVKLLNPESVSSPSETLIIYLDVGVKVRFKTAHLGCSTRVFHFERQQAKKIISTVFNLSHTPWLSLLAGTLLSCFARSYSSSWHLPLYLSRLGGVAVNVFFYLFWHKWACYTQTEPINIHILDERECQMWKYHVSVYILHIGNLNNDTLIEKRAGDTFSVK